MSIQVISYLASLKTKINHERKYSQNRLKAAVESDPAIQQCLSLFLSHRERKHRKGESEREENTSSENFEGSDEHYRPTKGRSIGSKFGLTSTIAAAAAVAVVAADTEQIVPVATNSSSEIPVVLRAPTPTRFQRAVRILAALIRISIIVAYFCCVLPVVYVVDKFFQRHWTEKAHRALEDANKTVEGLFSGFTGANASDFYDERYVVEFIQRGAESLLENMIANYAIQQLYMHPFVAEKYGKLEFNTSRGDSFARAVLDDADLVPMTPRTYEFSLHGSKSQRSLRVVAQVALGPPHGASVDASQRASLAIHTAYLAIEDPESKEKVVVVDPKNFHAQTLTTSILRLVDERSRLALVEGTSLTSVVITEQKLAKKSFSKNQDFSFRFCGSRGCARILSETTQSDPLDPSLATTGTTTVEVSNKEGFSSKLSFTESQISAANTVSFIELLRPVRDRLGGPITVDSNSIKNGLDIEIDKVINTVDMTLRGPNGQAAPIHLVFLVDPLQPTQKILWRVSWADSLEPVYENTASRLRKLSQPAHQ